MTLEQYKEESKKTIPNEYRLILDNLKEAESDNLHRNSTEADITTGTGIYKFTHPKAEIFNYIDSVAKSIGITTPSNKWSSDEILTINSKLDKTIIDYYSYEFYNNFYGEIDFTLFPDEVIIDIANLYANSPSGAKLAITRGAINLYYIDAIELIPSEVYEPIDKIGPKTINVLKKIREATPMVHKCFIMSLCFEMQQYYSNIITSNKDKVREASKIIPSIIYLNGWGNRLDNNLKRRKENGK